MTTVSPVSRFGLVDLADSSRVSSFNEKPKTDGWINAGFFVFERQVFDYLGGDDCILEREPLERLARDGQLMAYRHDGFFYAMDTYPRIPAPERACGPPARRRGRSGRERHSGATGRCSSPAPPAWSAAG